MLQKDVEFGLKWEVIEVLQVSRFYLNALVNLIWLAI